MHTPSSRPTKVVGYFNPNEFPVLVNMSSAGLNLTLTKGQYVVNRDGNKVNDPRLDAYVGPGQLARMTSDKPVPLVPLPDFSAPANQTVGFGMTSQVTKDSRGIVQDTVPNTKAPTAAQSPAVMVYSKEQALKTGVIKPVDIPPELGRDDTTGQPGRLDNVPSMKIAQDAKTPRRASELMNPPLKPALTADQVAPETVTPIKTSPSPTAPTPVSEELETYEEEVLEGASVIDTGALTREVIKKLDVAPKP